MQPIERVERFNPPTGEVAVVTLAARCEACGHESVLVSQMAENIARRRARHQHYGPHLLGEDIFAFRRKYGLTRAAAARIIGKSPRTFSRYETEVSFPNDATRWALVRAMQHPEFLKDLAAAAGVEIPLWSARNPA
ncbi:hypothetical protein GCM10028813_00850 [Ramlibacter alkalitolerans]|uniref:Type II toxin-antitoxin system MqsA family antitoxin n=2 Tax=Ramlibacter alkalitolerans TaxID=2039631 RepID=A0ABS1JUW3_9BURK|nr:type II toxin-antitoxin system MqsA family antitoxin [Ramlibacter alkalitolerans]